MKKINDDLDLLTQFLPISDQFIVDIGCGTGSLVKRLVEVGARAVGVDQINLVLGDLSTQKSNNIDLVAASGVNLPIKTETADLVTFLASLHHISKEFDALKEAHRILKHGSHVLIVEPLPQKDSYFELARLVEDETDVLKSTQAAITESARTHFNLVGEKTIYFERTFSDYQNQLEVYIEDKEKRGDILSIAKKKFTEFSDKAGVPLQSYRIPSICICTFMQKP